MNSILYELAGRDDNCRFSPHCWKSHLALEHKHIAFESVAVRYFEIAEVLSFAEYSLLPVLMDGELVITDSWHIACHLETRLTGPALFSHAADKALAETINHWCDSTLSPLIRPLIIMDIYHLLHDRDKAYFRESREARLGMTLEALAQKAEPSLLALKSELESVREILSIRDYLGGEKPNYADICLLSTFMWMTCVRDVQFVEQDDIVFDWYQRMLANYPSAKAAVKR